MIRLRLLTSLVAISIALVLIFWGSLPFALLILTASIWGCVEFYNMARFAGRRPFFILGCGLTVFLVLSIYYFGLLGISLAIPVVVIVVLIYSFLLNLERGDFTDAALTVMGVLYFPLISFLILLHRFERGVYLVTLVLALSWINDGAAYLIGSTWGQRKLAPHISPNKTIEGAAGALAVTILFSLILFPLVLGPLVGLVSVGLRAIFGLAISILAQLGDLAESFMKRKFELKDSGNTFPGQGGLLDCGDSVVFNAVFSYWFFYLLQLF
ncbi:MAG: Phosphatidate cytidylyltransferase [Actinobacteria bacterium]|nr:Phosphatidate cytidylyltransferase [Actinomycetota bacterium]